MAIQRQQDTLLPLSQRRRGEVRRERFARPQLAEQPIFQGQRAARQRLPKRLLEHLEPDRLILAVVQDRPAAAAPLDLYHMLFGAARMWT